MSKDPYRLKRNLYRLGSLKDPPKRLYRFKRKVLVEESCEIAAYSLKEAALLVNGTSFKTLNEGRWIGRLIQVLPILRSSEKPQ